MDIRKLLNAEPQPTQDVVMQDAQVPGDVENVIDDSISPHSHDQRGTAADCAGSGLEAANAAPTSGSAGIVSALPRPVNQAANGQMERSVPGPTGDGQNTHPLIPSHVLPRPIRSAAPKSSSAFPCELCAAAYGNSTAYKTATTFYGHLRNVHMLLIKTLHRHLSNAQLLTPVIPWQAVQFNGPMPWGFEAAYHTVESREWENGKTLLLPKKQSKIPPAAVNHAVPTAATSSVAIPAFSVAPGSMSPRPPIKRFQDSPLHRRLLYFQMIRRAARLQLDRPREVIDLTADEEGRQSPLVPKILSDTEMLAAVCRRSLLDVVNEAPMVLYRMPHVITDQASAQQCTAAELVDAINRERWRNGVRKRLVFEGGLIHEVWEAS